MQRHGDGVGTSYIEELDRDSEIGAFVLKTIDRNRGTELLDTKVLAATLGVYAPCVQTTFSPIEPPKARRGAAATLVDALRNDPEALGFYTGIVGQLQDDAWEQATGEGLVVRTDDLKKVLGRVSPIFALAARVVHGGINEWAILYSNPMIHMEARLSPHLEGVDVYEAASELWLDIEEGLEFPCHVETRAMSMGVAPDDLRRGAALMGGMGFHPAYPDFILDESPDRKMFDAMDLHRTHLEHFQGRAVDVEDLIAKHRERMDDPKSDFELEEAIMATGHLFRQVDFGSPLNFGHRG